VRLEVFCFSVGLMGDASRDVLGERAVGVVCELNTFFGVGMDEVEFCDLNADVGVDD
jgi:hypothetical protein